MKELELNKNNSSNEFDDSLGKYLLDPLKFINDWNEELAPLGLKIDEVEFQRNNPTYYTLSQFFIENKFDNYSITKRFNPSIVEGVGINNLRIHNAVTIAMGNGSHLKFSPYKENGIEITRLYVPEFNQGHGNGATLMNFLFSNISECLGYYPEMMVECVGQVGFGDTLLVNPIAEEVKFFKKFGFKVCVAESSLPDYAKLEFDLNEMKKRVKQNEKRCLNP